MTIASANLAAAYDGVDRTAAYTTASHTPTANRLVVAFIWSAHTTAPPQPTLSGNSLTWDAITSVTNPAGNRRVSAFRAQGTSPSAGATSIAHGGASMIGCAWIISEFSVVDRSGSNGAGAVADFATTAGVGAVTADDVNLPAFKSSLNATAAALWIGVNETVSMEGGYTSLGTVTGAAPACGFRGEFLASNDTTPAFSWTTSTANYAGVAIEIRHDWPAGTLHASRVLQAVGRGANW